MIKRKGRGGPGRGQGRHALYGKPLERVCVMLDPQTIAKAKAVAQAIGKKSISAGLREMARRAKIRSTDTPSA